MAEPGPNATKEELPRILLVDDEDQFRVAMAKQLKLRGYYVLDVDNGEDAIKVVRHKNPEVVVLDQKMPGMDGTQTLKELKNIRPEAQVIMLTGHGSIEGARVSGKHDVFHYMQKPCGIDELVEMIEAARQERIYAMARNEIPQVKKGNVKEWLVGVHNARPGFIIMGAVLFMALVFMPTPERLKVLLTDKKGPADQGQIDTIVGYSDYRKMEENQSITEYYSKKTGAYNIIKTADGKEIKKPLGVDQMSFRAKAMIGALVVAALFWATGAIPVGVTALLVGVLMYFFGVLPPDQVAQAFAKDSVIFIFGVLAISAVISKTGLDRRIGLLLLSPSRSLLRISLIFAPMLAVTASFLSEHALVAFIAPIFVMVYASAMRANNIVKDRNLILSLVLMLTFVANVGGPGSPAAGGRNAVMLGILADYGIAPTFGEWVKYGLPFVPVMAVVIGLYFYFMFGRKTKLKDLDVAAEVRKESEKIGKMTKNEYRTAAVLVLLIILWSTSSSWLGMGGPVILCLVLLNIMGILRWKDINGIHWDVVALYAAASAMGKGLAMTGAALWMADAFVAILPEFMSSGTWLCVATSLFSGIITNFMSDGATVAAIGPITVPMATIANTPPVMVGLATAFASSFAFMLVIGTPNNAIAFAMARDPDTGEQLITMRDFFIHGAAVLVLSFLVLWGWVFFGYWRWLSF